MILSRLAALIVFSLALAACGNLGRAPTPSATSAVASPTILAPTPASPTAVAPTESPPPTCSLAYSDGGGSLFCWLDDGTSRLISAGAGLGHPRLSPDGTLVAYTLTDGLGSQLWVVNADGRGQPHALAAQDDLPSEDAALIYSPLNFAWRAGTHTLVFDTNWYGVGGVPGPGERLNADLWRVEADRRSVTQLLPNGEAGRFSLSPDGRFAAISRVTGIDLLNLDSADLRRDLITFPALTTYSEYAYRPSVTWSPNSQSFSVAVPSPDPLAPDANVVLYRVRVDGQVQVLGALVGNFVFGDTIPVEFSPDGQYVVGGQTQPDHSPALYLAKADGTNIVTLDQRNPLQGWGWAPDSQRYAYTVGGEGGDGEGLVVNADAEGSTEVFLFGLNAMRWLRWRDSHSVLLHAQVNGRWGLWYLALGGVPQLLVDELGPEAQADLRP